jgi:hypothetical protein
MQTKSEINVIANRLEKIGFGPARSRTFAQKAPAFAAKIVAFEDACQAKGLRFRAFNASGRNGYYARLRLMVITGEADNAYADSRGYTGPKEDCEVGSMGITWAQIEAIEDAVEYIGQQVGIN